MLFMCADLLWQGVLTLLINIFLHCTQVIRCNAIRICRFKKTDPETGQHWVRFVSEIVRVGRPKVLSPTDRLLPKGLEVSEDFVRNGDEDDTAGDVRQVNNYHHPIFGAKSFLSVALLYNRKIWGYLLASRDSDMVDWSQSEKLLFEQTGNQISLAIAHASLWELKKSQQVEMEAAHAANEAKSQILANTSHELRTVSSFSLPFLCITSNGCSKTTRNKNTNSGFHCIDSPLEPLWER